MTATALLSLGGNMGDRKTLMDAAVARLAALPDTSLAARSSYYRTEPVGPVAQDWFVNLAIALETRLSRPELVAAGHRIEADLGRDRAGEIPSGPRPVDIDVIAHGQWSEADDRAFVLVPLAEIAPDALIEGLPVRDRLARIEMAGVEKLDWPLPPL